MHINLIFFVCVRCKYANCVFYTGFPKRDAPTFFHPETSGCHINLLIRLSLFLPYFFFSQRCSTWCKPPVPLRQTPQLWESESEPGMTERVLGERYPTEFKFVGSGLDFILILWLLTELAYPRPNHFIDSLASFSSRCVWNIAGQPVGPPCFHHSMFCGKVCEWPQLSWKVRSGCPFMKQPCLVWREGRCGVLMLSVTASSPIHKQVRLDPEYLPFSLKQIQFWSHAKHSYPAASINI